MSTDLELESYSSGIRGKRNRERRKRKEKDSRENIREEINSIRVEMGGMGRMKEDEERTQGGNLQHHLHLDQFPSPSPSRLVVFDGVICVVMGMEEQVK